MLTLLILVVSILTLFFIYRIWDELPDMIMSMKEQNRELTKIREILENASDSNS